MNNQEKTVHEYLSGYFGVDLNESIDLLTESDIIDAVRDLNTLVFALNERTASFGSSPTEQQKINYAKFFQASMNKLPGMSSPDLFAPDFDPNRKPTVAPPSLLQRPVDMLNVPTDKAAVARGKTDMKTVERLMNLVSGKRETSTPSSNFGNRTGGFSKIEDKMGIPGDKQFRFTMEPGTNAMNPAASVKDMQDRLDKYEVAIQNRTDRAKSNLAAVRATSQRNQAKRDAPRQETSRVGDPDRHAFLVKQGATPTGKSTGYAGDKTDSASFTLDDKLKFHVSKAAEKRQKKGDFSLPGGGYDYAAMAQSIRESRTLREQSGGASSSVVPGSEKKFGARDMTSRQGTLSPEEVKRQKDALAQAVADNPTSRAAMDAAAQHKQDTRPERLARAIARQAHSDRVQGEITTRHRNRWGRNWGALEPHQMMGTEASKAASGQTTLQDRYKAAVEKRATFGKSTTTPATTSGVMGPPNPPAVGSSMASYPKGAPRTGATTFEKPDGSGYSTLPPEPDPVR